KGSSRLFITTPLDERCYFRSGLTYNQKLDVRYLKVPFPPWLREMNQCRALVTLDFEMCVKITGSVFECRGKRGGPLSSANPVGSLLCFALFALAFGDFAFASCLAFTLSRILSRHLFCIAFAFIFGLGLLRVAFTLIFGLYFIVVAFALSITLL